tara:strand:+ start:55 stop:441 length:387 start_codon:yes stop_codon:yes gene_type:complete
MNFVLKSIWNWFLGIARAVRKDPRKILFVLLSPFLIHVMAEAILDFSWLAMVGYYSVCVYNFSKILEDPYRVIRWGVGYIVGAVAIGIIFDNVIPAYNGNDVVSIISMLITGFVVFKFYLNAEELKNS